MPYQYNPFQQIYNPYQTYLQPQQSGMTWVTSRAEVDMYPMAPNSAVALWHRSDPIVYIKQSDAAGRTSVREYALNDRSGSIDQQGANGATDLSQITSELKSVQSALEALREEVQRMTKEGKTDESDG